MFSSPGGGGVKMLTLADKRGPERLILADVLYERALTVVTTLSSLSTVFQEKIEPDFPRKSNCYQ